jgi:hypothetical protein
MLARSTVCHVDVSGMQTREKRVNASVESTCLVCWYGHIREIYVHSTG